MYVLRIKNLESDFSTARTETLDDLSRLMRFGKAFAIRHNRIATAWIRRRIAQRINKIGKIRTSSSGPFSICLVSHVSTTVRSTWLAMHNPTWSEPLASFHWLRNANCLFQIVNAIRITFWREAYPGDKAYCGLQPLFYYQIWTSLPCARMFWGESSWWWLCKSQSINPRCCWIIYGVKWVTEVGRSWPSLDLNCDQTVLHESLATDSTYAIFPELGQDVRYIYNSQ